MVFLRLQHPCIQVELWPQSKWNCDHHLHPALHPLSTHTHEGGWSDCRPVTRTTSVLLFVYWKKFEKSSLGSTRAKVTGFNKNENKMQWLSTSQQLSDAERMALPKSAANQTDNFRVAQSI
ncbi:uncharacterized protein LOC119276060 [Triticum dicoccoides]|uniref:uncharacterized protein LOC119276060 n=1 Tax=Triticum dicoccoides TaxID=85692 RepID=UPI0018903143|nr:uncharacterized protein LOC119276060 [Triticum dicoccoides]